MEHESCAYVPAKCKKITPVLQAKGLKNQDFIVFMWERGGGRERGMQRVQGAYPHPLNVMKSCQPHNHYRT